MSLAHTRKWGSLLGIACSLIAIITVHTLRADLSTSAKNDPFPMYKAVDPQEFLYTWDSLRLKGIPLEIDRSQNISLAISPFGQNACGGKNFCGERVPLGDLTGRWNMVGLLMGPLPEGKTLPPTLLAALENIFPGFAPGTLNDPNLIDVNQTFGFFSVPLKYLKRGVRWDFEAMLTCNLGFSFQGGVADICQKVTAFDNLTCMSCTNPVPCNGPTPGIVNSEVSTTTQVGTSAIPTTSCNCPGTPIFYTNQNGLNVPLSCCNRVCDIKIPCCGRFMPVSGPNAPTTTNAQFNALYPNYDANHVNQYLMNQLPHIAEEIGLNICNFHKVSAEDIRLNLFWRHGSMVNKGRGGWAEFLFIPYFMVSGSIGAADDKNPNSAFALPFGNNGHHSLGASGGFEIDFVETVEIGFDFGFTGFFGRDFCNYRVPNQVPDKRCQLTVYPFTTNVHIDPGFNWTFGAKMLAYQFIDRLSFYFQYILLHHEDDKICLKKPDPAFAPDILEAQSSFKAQLANIAFYYDISPNLNLGFLWQAPLWQRNAYASTTVMFSLWGTW